MQTTKNSVDICYNAVTALLIPTGLSKWKLIKTFEKKEQECREKIEDFIAGKPAYPSSLPHKKERIRTKIKKNRIESTLEYLTGDL